MKSIIFVALALVAVAAAATVQEPVPETVQYHFESQPDGSYKAGYESSNGITKFENGFLEEVLDEKNVAHRVIVTQGGYKYINSDGETEEIKYTADENGYHPEGKSIPVSP